jgi:hypothetical protein
MTQYELIILLEIACRELCYRCRVGDVAVRRDVRGGAPRWAHPTTADYSWEWFCDAGPVRDVIEAAKAGEKAR